MPLHTAVWQALTGEWETFSVIALSIALFVYLKAERPSWHALAVFGIFASSVIFMDLWRMIHIVTSEDKDMAYEVWATGNHGTFVVASVVVLGFLLWPPKKADSLALLLCVILVFSGVWTAFLENIHCNFQAEDIPFELQTPEQKEMSVCERLYGRWYTFGPTVFYLLVLAYFTVRWGQARRLRTG